MATEPFPWSTGRNRHSFPPSTPSAPPRHLQSRTTCSPPGALPESEVRSCLRRRHCFGVNEELRSPRGVREEVGQRHRSTCGAQRPQPGKPYTSLSRPIRPHPFHCLSRQTGSPANPPPGPFRASGMPMTLPTSEDRPPPPGGTDQLRACFNGIATTKVDPPSCLEMTSMRP